MPSTESTDPLWLTWFINDDPFDTWEDYGVQLQKALLFMVNIARHLSCGSDRSHLRGLSCGTGGPPRGGACGVPYASYNGRLAFVVQQSVRLIYVVVT